jgi:opacity protein-like surface antigen
MNKIITRFILLLLFFSSFGFAGTIDIPVANVPIPIEPEVDDDNLYLGLGISKMSLRDDVSDEEFSSVGVMLQLGYKINEYVAIEGRYTRNATDVKYDHGNTNNPDFSDYPAQFSNIAAYIKPMYPLGAWNMYVLLGYGQVSLTNIPLGGAGISADRAESAFQWGAGVSYDVTDDVDVFVDYVRFYDDAGFDFRATTADVVADAFTFGVSYKF